MGLAPMALPDWTMAKRWARIYASQRIHSHFLPNLALLSLGLQRISHALLTPSAMAPNVPPLPPTITQGLLNLPGATFATKSTTERLLEEDRRRHHCYWGRIGFHNHLSHQSVSFLWQSLRSLRARVLAYWRRMTSVRRKHYYRRSTM